MSFQKDQFEKEGKKGRIAENREKERFVITNREGTRRGWKRAQERKHCTLSANKPGFVVISFCRARVQPAQHTEENTERARRAPTPNVYPAPTRERRAQPPPSCHERI